MNVSYVGEKPKKAHDTDACYDLYSAISKTLMPFERSLFPSNFKCNVPEDHVMLVCSRSGLALNRGLFVLNAPGVVDPHYTGDVGVILCNMDSEPQTISEGDRIAQVMIVKPEEVNFIRVPKLIPYGRATDGFGSSGK